MDEIGYEASEGETLEDNNRSFPLPTLEYQIEVTDGITVTGDLICENQ